MEVELVVMFYQLFILCYGLIVQLNTYCAIPHFGKTTVLQLIN